MIVTTMSAAVDILEWANSWWNARIGEAFEFLTTSPPHLFSATEGESVVWGAMESIHSALLPVATTILAIIFLMALVKSTTDFQQLQSKETMMRHLTQFVFAYTVMRGSLFIFKAIIAIMQQLVNATYAWATGRNLSGGALVSQTIPASVAMKINNAGTWDKIIYVIVSFIMALAIFVISIRILLIVYSRFFKIFMYVAVSSVPLTFFASAEHRHTAWRFIKSFMALLLVGVLIIVSFVIFYLVGNHFVPDSPPDETPDLPTLNAFLHEHNCPDEVTWMTYRGTKFQTLNPRFNPNLRKWLEDNGLYNEYCELWDAWQTDPVSSAADRQEVFVYLGWRVFSMFMLMSIVGSSEQIAKEMIAG
ncbi:MAG TPA: hypothetical protein PL100_01025 [Bacillota bacterium]|nr:hypothetical protein [Bacillota bacterium]HQC48097.1 hypothetical protein [Bacillota bacterium]